MSDVQTSQIFLVCPPGLEKILADEARQIGLADVTPEQGGVSCAGDTEMIWRANLHLRCATRVLLRIASFPVSHLAQLDKKSRQIAWKDFLPIGSPVSVEAVCRKSKIYHSGAAKERIEKAAQEALSSGKASQPAIKIMARIERNICTISLDTSGEPLHKRGFKQAVGKAPLRETLAAAFLRDCGYDGSDPVLDPMCGSGTLVLEAAEIACGLLPGRARAFAFEQFTGFDKKQWENLRQQVAAETPLTFIGYDRDAGAIRMAGENARRAGLDHVTHFSAQPIDVLSRPEGASGLVIVNPPYGERIGNKNALREVYRTLGARLKDHFSGWRVGLITSDESLARATGLPFKKPGPPVPHGDLRIKLYQTNPL